MSSVEAALTEKKHKLTNLSECSTEDDEITVITRSMGQASLTAFAPPPRTSSFLDNILNPIEEGKGKQKKKQRTPPTPDDRDKKQRKQDRKPPRGGGSSSHAGRA